MKTFPNGNVNSPKETAPPEQSKDLVSTSFYPSMVEAMVECDMQVVSSDSPKETALSELPPDDAADPTSVIGLSKPPPEALSASMFPSAPLAPNTDPKVANCDPPKEAAPQDSSNQTSVTEPSKPPSESLSGVKPPPEFLSESTPPALQASDGSSSSPSHQSDSAANWEGELALSILNSGPRDAATGRRQSTMANSMGSAAAAVGAFAAKSDPSEEGAKKKKMEDENNRRRHSSYQPSTFDDRLRLKLERSRSGSEGGSDSGRRRSSRMSFASSVGTVESISENKPSKFEERSGFASIVEGRQDCKQEESEQPAAASSYNAGGLKSPPESIEIETYPSKEHLGHRRKPGSSAEQYQEFIMQKIAIRSDVGMTYSELKRQEEEAAAEEAAATVSATTSTTEQSGGQNTTDNVIGVFYTAAPRVRDEEEEKVEISSEDDIVEAAQEAEVEALQEGEQTIYAVCAAICAAVSDEKKTLSKSFAADAGKKYHYHPSHSLRASRCDKNSPFSSMVNERKKIVLDDYTSDPENLVDNTDEPPRRVSNPDGFQIQTSHHRTNPDISSPNNRDTLTTSFTGVLDRIIRHGHRTRSLEDVSLPAASNGEAGRRGTYAFEGGEAEQSYALRELADMVEAQDVVHATLVKEEKPVETVEAIPMDDDEDTSVMRHRLRKRIMLVWGPLLLLVAAIVAAILTIELGKDGSENDGNDDNLEKVPERVYDPTVVQVKKEGVLRCGVPEKYGFSIYNSATGEKEGISADYCKAVAAAVIGSDYEVELIDVTSLTRFTALAAHEIDLLIWGDTHTMERDFHEKAAGVGFQFTDVYFYDGLGFAGDPLAVQCADNFDWRSADCRDLKICVNAGVTHVDVLLDIFPQQNIIVAEAGTFFNQFVDGNCKVIAGEQNDISEIPVRINGYSGEFGYGQKVLSKEPLAMVTRKNDQSWTDVVNWVLRALVHAELTNVTQETAGEYYHGHSEHDHPSNSEINLILALEEVGNYGEIYARNMEEVVPRKGLNLLYAASEGNKSGLLYSHPTGVIDAFRHEFAPSGKINQILDRRKLICGVLGNEEQTMDADYCRALAASLFEGEVSLVDFVEISNGDNLMNMLDSGEIDAISGATIDFHSDIISSNETASGFSGLAFSQPYFYRGNHSNLFHQGAPGPKAMATSQTDSDWSTYVYWVVANLIWAEENGITSKDFRDAPEVKTFGDQFEWMFRGSILGVGNYGEIYERNMDTLPPRANQNLLNDGSSPQLWHPCDSSSGNCML